MIKKLGISLIVLIVTIIVIIILAAVVILTLSKNNPIESAKEARFKEDIRTFQDELTLYISKQYVNSGGHWNGIIEAKSYDKIIEYIPSFTKKYEGKIIISRNNLGYTDKLDDKEKEYAQSLNVKENKNENEEEEEEKEKLLPDEFRQVEYIESSGTQYIDTGILPSSEYKIITKISCGEGNNNGVAFGSRIRIGNDPWRRYAIVCFTDINNQKNSFRCDWGSVQNVDETIISQEQINEITCDKSGWYLNGNKINSFSNETWESGASPTLTVFCDHESGTVSGYTAKFIGKIYSFKLFNGDNLELNFIPCYSTTAVKDVNGNDLPKGTKGMYDLVEGKFYTNQGTGEFIAGPNV